MAAQGEFEHYEEGDVVELKDADGRFEIESVETGPVYRLKVIEFKGGGRGYQNLPPTTVTHSAIKGRA